MACYIISYDLRAPGRDYEKVYEKIKSFGKWAKITESTWAVVSAKTASQIRDDLKVIVDANDRLFVVKSGVEAAWRNTKCTSEWLRANL